MIIAKQVVKQQELGIVHDLTDDLQALNVHMQILYVHEHVIIQ